MCNNVILVRSLDEWYWWLQVALTVATLVVGGLSVITIQVGRALHKRDTARLVSLDSELFDARAELNLQREAAAAAAAKPAVAATNGATDEGGAPAYIRVRDRSLTLDQRSMLIQLLSTDKGDVQIVGLALDPESQGFAGELVAAFRAGGWSVSHRSAELKPLPSGLMVWVHDRENPPHRAGTLRFALDAVGFRTTSRRNTPHRTDVPDGSVWLVVGPNPHQEGLNPAP